MSLANYLDNYDPHGGWGWGVNDARAGFSSERAVIALKTRSRNILYCAVQCHSVKG